MTASAICTHLEGEANPALQEMAQEVETTSKTVQRELTRLIENLEPGSLEEKGLASALNDYTLLFGAREHILVYLDVQGNDALLPASVSESLYRVAQEALHNVARHAHATRVDVMLRCLPEQATLVLRDNGTGFDTQQARRGLGLGSMQDRMMSIGGRLTLTSAIGGGTTVRAEVALTRPLSLQAETSTQARDHPNPTVENWGWLGQRLVIPVGQTWPWLPADQVHLRHPLVESSAGPLVAHYHAGLLGLGRHYRLELQPGVGQKVRIYRHRSNYHWSDGEASWALRQVRGPSSAYRAVLMRNRQPLAALQTQGRLLHRWTEIVYDDRGYQLAVDRDRTGRSLPGRYVLVDQSSEPLLRIDEGPPPTLRLCRTLALPLLIIVLMQTISEDPLEITQKESQA
jgi:two-component sensor histidine kinase